MLKGLFGVKRIVRFPGVHNQFQNLSTVLGHYDFQISPANHFSNRGYWYSQPHQRIHGRSGPKRNSVGFGSTENFINQGISSIFSLNTVLGSKVNEIRVSIEA